MAIRCDVEKRIMMKGEIGDASNYRRNKTATTFTYAEQASKTGQCYEQIPDDSLVSVVNKKLMYMVFRCAKPRNIVVFPF